MFVGILFFQHCSCSTFLQGGRQVRLHGYQNEILYGFVYSNITDSSIPKCLQHCLLNCMCLSFQICGNTCQLCSSTKKLNSPTSVRYIEGCTRFEIENRADLHVSHESCVNRGGNASWVGPLSLPQSEFSETCHII